MKYPTPAKWLKLQAFGTLLYDVEADPAQEHPIEDEALMAWMRATLTGAMEASFAPGEEYRRLGLK